MVNGVKTKKRVIGSNTPQGSPLSPTLFAICLLEALSKDTINYINHGTDVREWRPGIMQEIVKEKKQRLKEVKMVLDKTKTEVCIFRKKRKDQEKEAPEGMKKRITYLGMRMNEKLNWKDHIEYRL